MIYLDNAATGLHKAPGVPEAVSIALEGTFANVSRSSHSAAIAASSVIFETRQLAAQLLGAEDSSRVIFTSGTTLSLNMVILGTLQHGDTVLVSPFEHNAVMRPLQRLAKQGVITIERFSCTPGGNVNMRAYHEQLESSPKLVICTACSNVTGTILPWQELAQMANRAGVLFCLDAAQALGTQPLSVKEAPIDFLCASGHKGLLGPTGTGLLYVAPNVSLEPVICGGTGSQSSSDEQPSTYPDALESGTPNIAGIAGLQVCIGYLLKTGIPGICRHIEKLTALAYNELSILPDITIHSPATAHGIISFTHQRLSVSELTGRLDDQQIAVRCGLHCAPAAHQAIGTFPNGTIRLSFSHFNTKQEIIDAVKAIRDIIDD